MIDYLTFIDELKAIKNANDTIESKKRVSGIIDQTFKKYGSENGKILPSRITSVSQKKQRELSLSIKRARNLALL